MTLIYFLEKNNIPFYIGKTTDQSRRKSKHREKFSFDTFYILDEVEDNDWKFWEKYYISLFKSWGFKLENKNKGGGGPTKWSDIQKLTINPSRIFKIINHSTRKINISNALKDHKKHYTKEIRIKISKSNKGKTHIFTENHKNNIQIASLRRAKPVLQLDLENNFIKEWASKGLAAKWIKEQTGKTSNITSQLKDCILGRTKTSHGFKWKYKD